jgi:hypothetical protein
MNAFFGGASQPRPGSSRAPAGVREAQRGHSDSGSDDEKGILEKQRDVETAVLVVDARGTGAVRTASGIHDLEQQQQQLLPQSLRRAQQGAGTDAAPAVAAAPAEPAGAAHLALTAIYGLTNLSSVVMIVVANKKALFTHEFNFPVTLTWLHAVFTAVGMSVMARSGFFERK